MKIKDINDHRPQFESTTYNVTIREDLLPSAEIIKLVAVDADSDESNRNLVYRIVDATNEESLTRFKISDEG